MRLFLHYLFLSFVVRSLQAFPIKVAVENALKVLEKYDKDYIARITEGSRLGLSPQSIEFKRVQLLKKDGILQERSALRNSIEIISKESDRVVIGIMAVSGTQGLEVLRAWTTGLQLPRNILSAVDEITSEQIPLSVLDDKPVYIKYDSGKNGDAYMKQYNGEFSGVLFQPLLSDAEFRQYGNFPIGVFN